MMICTTWWCLGVFLARPKIRLTSDLLALTIIMANLPPPDHAADLPDDEPVQPEPAPIIPDHAPAQPEGYVGDDDMEDDEEEDPDEDPKEEPIEQVVPRAKQYGWVEEDGVDDDDEEEMEMDDDDEDNGGDDDEDEEEVINAYEEVDPLNRPPPTSDEKTEFVPPVVPIVDVDDEPIPPVIQFGHNFHVGESSSDGTLLKGNSWVHAPGPMPCDLKSVHRWVTRLDKQMFDRYKIEKKMARNSRRMNFEEPPIHSVSAPRVDDPYAMVRDVAMAAHEDDNDDTTTPRDSQPFELRGSPRDLQIMPPKGMSDAAISKLVADKVAEALEAGRATRNNPNCGPTQFHGNEGAVELCRWFEKTESVFRISDCTERIATLGLAVINGKSWDDMKKMMLEEFYPSEEIQRLENELRSLKLRDTNIAAYTQRFNELALLCPEAVPSEKKKFKHYIKG
ncbi:putative reverse transcriptase domain-containing protein [Tanacetum coccineum]